MREAVRGRWLARIALLAIASIAPAAWSAETLRLPGFDADAAPMQVTVYLPAAYEDGVSQRYPVLYLNDGQDAQAVGLERTLASLQAQGLMRAAIVVAIDMPPDRMAAYGLSDRARGASLPGDTRFGPVGAQAHAYSEWVAHALVPYIDAHYRTIAGPHARVVAGWSLGALNAFNLGWRYPEVFATVGAMSPSFWLPGDRSDAAAAQRTRLALAMMETGPAPRGASIWIAVGNAEETDDRDGDGIADAVDDAQDMAHAWANAGYPALDPLRPRPVSSDAAGEGGVALLLVEGGHHDQSTWARMLPRFLRWAFPR